MSAAPHATAVDVSPAIEAVGISKHFDGVFALNGAALSVRPGEIHALLGENGAGKSTLVKVLTGVYRADSGRVLRGGEEVAFANSISSPPRRTRPESAR